MSIFLLVLVYTNAVSFVDALPTNSTAVNNKLLLISFDGFRHDYLEKALSCGINISGFQRIWESGFRAMRMQSEFVTQTGPNHFSMVTGQHVETHGLVENKFFDPHLNRTFLFSNSTQAKESVWFDNGAEPIWVTNQLHGYRTGITSWTGAFAPIKGILPSVSYPAFNASIPLRKSIDDALGWLEDDKNLAMIYHTEPDAQAHRTGPSSMEVLHAIEAHNQDVEYLLDRVRQSAKLNQTLNIIVASDHGLADVSPERVIVLDEFLNDNMYNSVGNNVRVIWALWPKGDVTPGDLVHRLRNKHPKMNVFLKEEMPIRLFYSKNDRIAPVLVYAKVGWLIVKSKQDGLTLKGRGAHGYDPASPDMSPFLLATGPGFYPFPPNHTIPFIKLIDLYPMMCHLLGLENPGPHNGSLAQISHLLRPMSHKPEC